VRFLAAKIYLGYNPVNPPNGVLSDEGFQVSVLWLKKGWETLKQGINSSRGSQPVARGPKVARQASRSGPRPLNKEK